jgi:hypothetical protein
MRAAPLERRGRGQALYFRRVRPESLRSFARALLRGKAGEGISNSWECENNKHKEK